VDGLTCVCPACTVATDCSTDWLLLLLIELLLVELVEPEDQLCCVEPPLESEATSTGAFASTGALALVAGLTDADEAWTEPSDCDTL